jgi:acyl-coenzyme A synthetase/AMP-(fatty) acid ligase
VTWPWLHEGLDRVWLRPGGATQRQLLAQAAAVAARVGRDVSSRRVALACQQARNFVPGLLGAWLAGVTVELLPNVQPATLERALADEDIGWIVHDVVAFRHGNRKEIFVPEVAAAEAVGPQAAPNGPTVAVRLSTSGTTGFARHSLKSMAQLVSEVEVLATLLPPARVVFSTVPLSHIYGLLFGVLLPLRQGSAIVSHDALLLPVEIGSVIEAEAVDRLVSTPAHLRALVGLMKPELEVVSSGGRLPSELHLALGPPHGGRVTDVLGSTETGGIATRTDPRSRWTPLPGATVRADATGNLVVRSPWCDGGAAVLEDRVDIAEDGSFRHLGRTGDLVKIAGKRADAAAIEATIRALPGVADVALLPVTPAPGRETRLAVAIVASGGVSRADVVAAIRDEFDAVFAPRIVRFVDSIPRTDRGKVSSDALRVLLSIQPLPGGQIPMQRIAAGRYLADVPAGLSFFDGHFDGQPILPGVVIVDRLVWPVVRAELPEVTGLRAVRRLRFRRPIRPEQELTVRIDRRGDRVDFEVSSAGDVFASGQLFVR